MKEASTGHSRIEFSNMMFPASLSVHGRRRLHDANMMYLTVAYHGGELPLHQYDANLTPLSGAHHSVGPKNIKGIEQRLSTKHRGETFRRGSI